MLPPLSPMRFLTHPAACLLAVSLLAGCTISRNAMPPASAADALPGVGTPVLPPAVRIDRVDDARRFEPRARLATTPSLNDDEAANPAVRARAFAQKRDSNGRPLGSVLLPAGQSVAKLTEATILRVLQDAGYRVAKAGDADFARAMPVTARIDRLWAWTESGFWQVELQASYDVTVSAALPGLQQGPRFVGTTKATMQFPTASDWNAAVTRLQTDLAAQMRAVVPKAP
ncbi:hypothetical protein [Pigmentiphaga litoralis]|uniref:hypothetical protein n=1 Tax=Pigmentiphaga litoralis TaxID=516702 RepID=UPI00167C0EB1|nr:hypothetical protein [Pigmentiphaga litoralis]